MKTKLTYVSAYSVLLLLLFLTLGCGNDTSDIKLLKQQGMAAFNSKNFMEATKYFKKGLRASQSDRDFLFYLGVSYAEMNMFDSAMIYIRRAKLLYPRDRDVNKELVQLCPKFEDYDCALRAIAVLVATGDNEKMYWPQLAEFNYHVGNYILAVQYYKLALADNPDIPNYYLLLSVVLGQMGKYDEAISYLKKSIDRFGPSEESYANIGTMYINIHQFDKAEENFRSSLALNPDNISVWINLANILSMSDNPAKKREALEIYKKYRSRTPKMYNLDSLIPALEEELGS
jgi:tetratricopeptide (TPR) repeat protein